MSMSQLQRDKRAIFQTLPVDGTPMLMAEVLLRAGEGLGRAMSLLKQEGLVTHSMIDDCNAYALTAEGMRKGSRARARIKRIQAAR